MSDTQAISFIVSYLFGSVLIPLQIFLIGLAVLLAVSSRTTCSSFKLMASLPFRLGLS